MAPSNAEFSDHADDNRRIWERNARWWDDRIGDGNDFQELLIEPATERLLEVRSGDRILDAACGAGRFARRMANLGASVLAFDQSREFIGRSRERTSEDADIDYRVIDATDEALLLRLGEDQFDKAVCTMALMDMPQIEPLFAGLSRVLQPRGPFVFSVSYPCFHSAAIRRFAEMHEEEAGRHVVRSGVKVWAYASPFARKTEGIVGQPEPQWHFHRPVGSLFQAGFDSGFVVDGIQEPVLPELENRRGGLRWDDMPEIPPVMVVRMLLHDAA